MFIRYVPRLLNPKTLRQAMPITTISADDHAKSSSNQRNPYSQHNQDQPRNPAQNAPRGYQRIPDHIAPTGLIEESYVLTLHTNAAHHASMTSIRKKYFPTRINKLDAHIALFRALPGSQLDRIRTDISHLTTRTSPFAIRADRPFRLSKGVGIGVRAQEASAIHATLRERWLDVLSRQDRGGFRAHYTVMNKVDDETTVEHTLEELKRDFRGCDGRAEGLALWRYEKGWWKDREVFVFEQ